MDGDTKIDEGRDVLTESGDEEKLMFYRCSTCNKSLNIDNLSSNTKSYINTAISNKRKVYIYCNAECRTNNTNTICPICSKSFTINKKQKTHIYCSAKCRAKAWNNKHPRVTV